MRRLAEREKARNSFVSVYDGTACLGHVLARGKAGFEAFDPDDKSIGIFKIQAEAARALPRRGES